MNDELRWGTEPTNLEEFVFGAAAHHRKVNNHTPAYRLGQAYANYFAHHFPEEYPRIIATYTDPFHNDDNIPFLLNYIMKYQIVEPY